jgi:thioredoxin reductase
VLAILLMLLKIPSRVFLIFRGEDNADPPAVLSDAKNEIAIDLVWDASIGSGAQNKTVKLVPVVSQEKS